MTMFNKLNTSFIDKYFIALTISTILIIGGIGTLVLLWPQYKSIQVTTNNNYTSTENAVAQRQQYLNDLQIMQNNYENLDQRMLRDVDTILPPDQDTSALFQEMQLLFNTTNFKVTSINVAEQAPDKKVDKTAKTTEMVPQDTLPPDVKTLQISVSITTPYLSYNQFKEFLSYIERYDHLLNLKAINYSPNSTDLTLLFTTYQYTSHEPNVSAKKTN